MRRHPPRRRLRIELHIRANTHPQLPFMKPRLLAEPLALPLRGKHFPRLQARQQARQLRQRRRTHRKLAGGKIKPRHRALFPRQPNRRQIMRRSRRQQPLLRHRPRRHNSHNIPPHDRLIAPLLRLLRRLQLLANRDLAIARDQLLQVHLRRMHRHAAHRNRLPGIFPPLGQRNIQNRRGDLRVLKKQLVKIPHPIEQQHLRIARLNLEILLHRRGCHTRRNWCSAHVICACLFGFRQYGCGLGCGRHAVSPDKLD